MPFEGQAFCASCSAGRTAAGGALGQPLIWSDDTTEVKFTGLTQNSQVDPEV